MSRERKVKLAAAIAAIMHFEAESQPACAAGAETAVLPAAPVLPIPALWGLAGRQENMMMRTLLQRRAAR